MGAVCVAVAVRALRMDMPTVENVAISDMRRVASAMADVSMANVYVVAACMATQMTDVTISGAQEC